MNLGIKEKNLDKKIASYIILVLGVIFIFSSCHPSEHTGEKIYKGIGIVKDYSIEESWITLEHRYIKGYSSFGKTTMIKRKVNNSRLLKSIQIDDNVEFELTAKGDFVILTGLKKIE